MRIGILSLNPGHNYGGILQSFALQTILKGMGHDVSIICKNVYEKEPDFLHCYIYAYRILRMIKHRTLWKEPIAPEHSRNQMKKYIRQNTDRFMSIYLNRKMYDNFSDIKEGEYDCFIVGSDQIWRKVFFEYQYTQSIENAFLSFAENWDVKRVAYAASFGTDDWEYTETDTRRCGELLRKFDAISVREDSGVRLCREKFGVFATRQIDPTLLIEAKDYIKILNLDVTPKSKGNLLVYLLDKNEDTDLIIDKFSKEKKLIPFETNSKSDRFDISNDPFPKVEEWVQGFRDAEFIITDSFHACVFSLIFHKPFIVLGNRNRGITRIESLLKLFGLENRLIYDFNCIENLPLIDFCQADKILAKLKRESITFLDAI